MLLYFQLIRRHNTAADDVLRLYRYRLYLPTYRAQPPLMTRLSILTDYLAIRAAGKRQDISLVQSRSILHVPRAYGLLLI